MDTGTLIRTGIRTGAAWLAVGALACAVPALADDGSGITVSGRGELTAQPDRARLVLGVEARNEQLQPARDEVGAAVTTLLEFVRSLGVEDRHINATAITVRPEYEWVRNGRERRFVGYYVSRQVEVELRDLERLGTLIEGAVDRGANRVGDPVLDVIDRGALRREALALAAAQAREHAEVLADALGVTLGTVRRVDAVDLQTPRPGPPMLMMRADMAESAAADSYAAGELRFEVQITAEFALESGSEDR